MALFVVSRYLGDEEEGGQEQNKKDKASEILKKLKDQANAKKASKVTPVKSEETAHSSKSGVNEIETDKHRREVLRQRNSDSENGAESSSKKRKKKRKTLEIDQTHEAEVSKRIKLELCVDDVDGSEHGSTVLHKHKQGPLSSYTTKEGKVNNTGSNKDGSNKKGKKRKKGYSSDSGLQSKYSDESDILESDISIKVENDVTDSFASSSESSSKEHKRKKKKKGKVDSSNMMQSRDSHDANIVADVDNLSDNKDNEELESESVEVNREDIVKEDVTLEEGEADEADVRPGEIKEIGGFTVIGSVKKTKVEKVKRVLPDWLSSPSVVSADLTTGTLPVTDMPGLEKDLIDQLIQNNISRFFPVQMHVIPALLKSSATGPLVGRAGYRPSDICVSAPTGSGKTLAFVIPLVQALRSCVTRQVRALVVLPVQDLAMQVFQVFQQYCVDTNLKVGLLVGQRSLAVEQQSLVCKRLRGYESMYDIVVATPGRLVDHINNTEGFQLAHLRYLVIDEADRMMDVIKHDWLMMVETAVHKHKPRPSALTAASSAAANQPLQKLLFSATLSQNPEKLQQLNLFQPVLFTSTQKGAKSAPTTPTSQRKQKESNQITDDDEAPETIKLDPDTESGPAENMEEEKQDDEEDLYGKYATPPGLTEYMIKVTAGEKPLIVLHLLLTLKYKNILCFTNSLESTHRLYLLIKQMGGIKVKEFSSGLHRAVRTKILQQFAKGNIDILICSDAMTRGIDIANVEYVVSYDVAPYIKTYVHRVGRTARAGREGTAFTLLLKNQFYHFNKMIREAGKTVRPMKVRKWQLTPLIPGFQEALQKLPDIIKEEKARKKGHMHKGIKVETKPTEEKGEDGASEATSSGADNTVSNRTGKIRVKAEPVE